MSDPITVFPKEISDEPSTHGETENSSSSQTFSKFPLNAFDKIKMSRKQPDGSVWTMEAERKWYRPLFDSFAKKIGEFRPEIHVKFFGGKK